jgi:hypothetical protein
MQNVKSLNMFKKIGFQEVKLNEKKKNRHQYKISNFHSFQTCHSDVFQEITMKKSVDAQFLSWLRLQTTNSRSVTELVGQQKVNQASYSPSQN